MRARSITACLIGILVAPLARTEEWQPVAEGSTLSFTAVQQGATFDGQFKRFSTNFEMDPASPTTGRIEAIIEMDSVDTFYDERDEVLREADWFDVARWPEARFITEQIKPAENGGYVADALLTMRDTSKPVTMTFNLEPLDNGQLRFTGDVTLKRLDFGVGQGQWTNTDWVGNEVTVHVVMLLQPALP
jgi:polyisoprenoid-binding protein YceI